MSNMKEFTTEQLKARLSEVATNLDALRTDMHRLTNEQKQIKIEVFARGFHVKIGEKCKYGGNAGVLVSFDYDYFVRPKIRLFKKDGTLGTRETVAYSPERVKKL